MRARSGLRLLSRPAAAVVVLALVTMWSAPAHAITYGALDGGRHPAVVLIVMEEAGHPSSRCSGTLIAPRAVLTAGHCTGAPGEFSGMRIFTEADVDGGKNSFPFSGPSSVEAASWRTHPLYRSQQFFRHDVGVITLKKAVRLPVGAEYGKLPTAGQLDTLNPGKATRFTAVGYGAQRINPVHVEAALVRMLAEPHLLQVNPGLTGDYSLLLSNNASTGGTCFGDSGGPNYLGSSNVIAGVTSFGLNGTCGGTGGVFRLDRPHVLSFVNEVLAASR